MKGRWIIITVVLSVLVIVVALSLIGRSASSVPQTNVSPSSPADQSNTASMEIATIPAGIPSLPTLTQGLGQEFVLVGVVGIIAFEGNFGSQMYVTPMGETYYMLMDGKGGFIRLKFADLKTYPPAGKTIVVKGRLVKIGNDENDIALQVKSFQVIQ
jgi:hypothetical protein